MKRIFSGIIFVLFMMIMVPCVNAAGVVIDDMKYADGSDVDVKLIYGYGSGGPAFIFPKEHKFSSADDSLIEVRKLISNDNKITIDIEANDDDLDDFTDNSNWNVKIIFKDIDTDENNIVYSDVLTGKEIKDSKKLTLDLKDLDLNKYYSFDIIMDNADVTGDEDGSVWYQVGEEGYAYYDNFLVGNKYSYKINAYINDLYGLTDYNQYIYLKNFYEGFDSFKLSFELLYKEENANYTLKEYYCVFSDEENATVSKDDVCTLNDTEENVSLNTEYFRHTVDETLYENTFKNIDYIKYEIYKGEDKVTDKLYILDHDVSMQLNFVTYTITDDYGHNVLEDKISNTKKLHFNFKGVNFVEDEIYYVSVYEFDQSNVDDDNYDWEEEDRKYRESFKQFTGKQLNDGTAVYSIDAKYTKNVEFSLEVQSKCDYNEELDNCNEEDYLGLMDYVDGINIKVVNDVFKTYTVKNLSITGINYNQVKLTFDEVADASGYQIYRSTKKSSGYTLLGTTDTNEYIDTKASLKTTYYYKVRAYNDASGSNVYSKFSTYKYGKAVLLKPSITVSSYNYNTIKVSYDKVDGATGYQIYRATSKNGKYSLIKTTTSLSYLDKSRATGKTYYYKVRAYRTISGKKYYGSYSSYKYTYSRVGTPVVSVNSYDFDSIKVSITKKPLGASGYEIYRSTSGESGTWTRVARTTKTYFYDNNLETGATYYYKVRAYRTVSGTRKYGNYTEAIQCVPKVSTPDIVTINFDRKTILVGINEVIDGAQMYEIYEIINGEKILLTSTEEGGYWHEDLVLGTSHTYTIRAYLDNGLGRQYSDYSDEITTMVRPGGIFLNIESDSFHTHTISGYDENIAESDDYNIKIYRSTSKYGDYEVIYDGTCQTLYEDGDCYFEVQSNDLYMNKTYYYKAISTLNGVESVTEDYFMEYIFDMKASQKPEIQILPYEFNKVIIGQNYDEEIDGYQIYRATSKNGKYTKIYDGADNVSILTPGFKKGYYYKVRYYKYYEGKKVYSPYSSYKYLKTGVKHLGDYPVLLEGDYGDTSVKSVTFNYKRTAGDYVYYDVKVNYNYTYSTKNMTNYYTINFLDWSTYEVSSWTFYASVPRGTKRNWSTTHTIKVPKSAVYFYFE